MGTFDKIFRRNSRQIDTSASKLDGQGDAATKEAPAATDRGIDDVPPPDGPPPSQRAAAPAQGPPPMGPPPPQGYMTPGNNPAVGIGPGHQYQQVGQNAGMLGGMVADGGGGMVDGMVVGGMVGQRVDQARNRAYWRPRAMEYRQALAAGQPPLSEQIEAQNAAAGGGPGYWSREGRELRRLKRWERRAARRD